VPAAAGALLLAHREHVGDRYPEAGLPLLGRSELQLRRNRPSLVVIPSVVEGPWPD